VYPTLSNDPTPNSDMNAGPEDNNVVRAQFARFASQCKLYAPLYRQVTLKALSAAMAGGGGFPADRKLGYEDDRAAVQGVPQQVTQPLSIFSSRAIASRPSAALRFAPAQANAPSAIRPSSSQRALCDSPVLESTSLSASPGEPSIFFPQRRRGAPCGKSIYTHRVRSGTAGSRPELQIPSPRSAVTFSQGERVTCDIKCCAPTTTALSPTTA
jgi:hypothetical protein